VESGLTFGSTNGRAELEKARKLNEDREPGTQQFLDFSVNLAGEAGVITERYSEELFRRSARLTTRSWTIAEREAERSSETQSGKAFPDDAISGLRKKGGKLGSSVRRWIITDDGTYAFVHGVPFYGVMIDLKLRESLYWAW